MASEAPLIAGLSSAIVFAWNLPGVHSSKINLSEFKLSNECCLRPSFGIDGLNT